MSGWELFGFVVYCMTIGGITVTWVCLLASWWLDQQRVGRQLRAAEVARRHADNGS